MREGAFQEESGRSQHLGEGQGLFLNSSGIEGHSPLEEIMGPWWL